MDHREHPWRQELFVDELDDIVEREGLDDDIRLIVLPWVMSRLDDPYRGVRRQLDQEHPEFGNLWFGAIPDTDARPGQVMTCSYWVSERNRLLRCSSFAMLSLPL